jgi:hypothetical protein
MTARNRILTIVGLLAISSATRAAPPGGPDALSGGPWPKSWPEGALTLSLYQPEVQHWDGKVITYRAAAQV